MKLKSLCFGMLFLLVFACHSFSQNATLANEINLPLDGVTDINISYDDEQITFFTLDSNELVVKEYMSKDKKSFYANVKVKGNSIRITEGLKPLAKKGFVRRVEIFLPSTYSQSFTLSTTSGNINMEKSYLKLESIHVNTTSGNVIVNNVTATKIFLTTTSGTINCNELVGNVDYKGTHGNINVKSAKGSGTYKAENSGTLDVNYSEVNGNLYFLNKNSDIKLTLPKNFAFHFEATSKNGSIVTSFQDSLVFQEKTAKGNVDKNPTFTVKVESGNGNISVSK